MPAAPNAWERWSRLILLVSGSAAAMLAGDGSAKNVEWGAFVDVNRRYYWAGMPLSDGPVLNPSLWAQTGPWRGELFLNLGLTEDPKRRRLDLVDLYLSRSWKMGPFEVTPNFESYFNRPSAGLKDPHTTEFGMRVAAKWGAVEFAASNTTDVLTYAGANHGDFEVATERRWRGFVLSGGAKTGWASADFNRAYAGFGNTAMTFTEAACSARRSLGPRYFVQPHFEVRRLLGGKMRSAFPNAPNWTFGLGIGIKN